MRRELIWVRSSAPTTALPTGLQAWYRSTDVTTDGNGYVDQLADLSGNGRHAVPTEAHRRPSMVANMLNGYAALRFDGVDDWLNAGVYDTTWSGLHIYAIASHRTLNGSQFAIVEKGGSFGLRNVSEFAISALSTDSYGWSEAARAAESTWPVGQFVVAATYYTSGDHVTTVNGASAPYGSTNTRYTGNITSNGSQVRIADGGAGSMALDLVELLIYNEKHSEAQQNHMKAYFENRYGLVY